jgi:guanylate kinase
LGSSTARRHQHLPVFVITGPSGAGKGTLERELLERMPELELAISATTRERRPSEREAREYYFLSHDEFERRIDRGEFLEWVDYVGNRYGTLRSEIDRIRSAGRAPMLDLEIEGALRVRDEIDGAVAIFVTVSEFGELERRLRERATESSGEIDDRLEIARRQLTQQDDFDHVVVNDEFDRAVEELAEIVTRELSAAGTMAP